jgi:hypothetical protein
MRRILLVLATMAAAVLVASGLALTAPVPRLQIRETRPTSTPGATPLEHRSVTRMIRAVSLKV